MPARIDIHPERLAAFCERHGISEISLFGSVLREDFGPERDVDVLVDFLPDKAPSFFGLDAMEEELTLILGRRVDLVPKGGVRGRIRDNILAQREVAYVATGRQDISR